MADRIAVLRDGRLEQFGKPLDLYNRPATLFVAGFIGSPRMNFLDGTVAAIDAATVTVALKAGGSISAACTPMAGAAGIGGTVKLGVRPEHISVAADGAADVRMTVTLTEQLGGESYLHGTLPSGEVLSVRLAGQTSVVRGDVVGLTLGVPDTRHVFDAASGAVYPHSA